MTSPLRRKRPTTRPSFRRRNSPQPTADSQEPRRRLRVGSLSILPLPLPTMIRSAALMTLVACLSRPATASELRWRSDPATTVKTTTIAKPAPAKSSTELRFVRPQKSTQRVDSSVHLVAFEDESPRLTSGREADTPSRSVIVNREDATDAFRSAQLPPPETGASSTGAPAGSPFGDVPADMPQLQTPQLETPPMPEPTAEPPAPRNNTLQFERQQRQPVQQPVRNPPVEQQPVAAPTGQFQPVLPSGPTPPEGTGPPAPITTPTATIEADNVKAKDSCSKSLENLRAYTIDKVNLRISITGAEGQDYPFECAIDDGTQHPGRCWEQTTYLWKASALCHKPLYFEDEQLERYGHSFSPCFQPFISGAHFFCTLPVLPYCMGVEPPCECIYALGYYRPGSCAPYMCNPIPLSPRGALFEVGAVTGAAAALP